MIINPASRWFYTCSASVSIFLGRIDCCDLSCASSNDWRKLGWMGSWQSCSQTTGVDGIILIVICPPSEFPPSSWEVSTLYTDASFKWHLYGHYFLIADTGNRIIPEFYIHWPLPQSLWLHISHSVMCCFINLVDVFSESYG